MSGDTRRGHKKKFLADVVARRAGNTAQVNRAWSQSVPADTPGQTILDQSQGDGHSLAHPAGKDSERQHLKGAFAP